MITLTSSRSVSITLPDPQIGDSETLRLRTKVVPMRSGAVHTYLQGSSSRLLLQFSVSKLTLAAFKAWYLSESGFGTTIDGKSGAITNNPIEFISECGQGDCTKYNFTLEFEQTV